MQKILRFALVLHLFTTPAVRAGDSVRTPFAGRWELQVKTPEGANTPFAIVQIDVDNGKAVGKLIAGIDRTMVVQQVSINNDEVMILISAGPSRSFVFRGRKAADRLAGTAGGLIHWVAIPTSKNEIETVVLRADQKAFNEALGAPSEVRTAALRKFLSDFPETSLKDAAQYRIAMDNADPPRLRAALEKFMREFPASSLRDQVAIQLSETVADPDARMQSLRAFLTEFPQSDLRQSVYLRLIDALIFKRPVDEAELRNVIGELAAESQKSDPEQSAETANSVGERLLVADICLDSAEAFLQSALNRLPDSTPQPVLARYVSNLGQLEFRRKEYDKAEPTLKEAIRLSGAGVNWIAHLALGRIYEVQDKDEAALQQYLQATAGRSTGETKSSMERVYTRIHGSLDGLHELFDKALLSRPRVFDPGKYVRDGSSDPEKVVVAELFSGSDCGPCAAADVAFDALLQRYDRKMLALLEYHLNVPGPDPMTNPDTESRARFYGVDGTPTAFIDGRERNPGGGPASLASQLFEMYRRKIEDRVTQHPPVRFKDLALRVQAGTVTISGELAGAGAAPEDLNGISLRLALAEELLHYSGANGVHFHHFVVRKMFEPRGVRMGSWPVRFSAAVVLSELNAGLKRYVEDFERQFGEDVPGFRFQQRLDEIDSNQLCVVAFVQNDVTREILQASFARIR